MLTPLLFFLLATVAVAAALCMLIARNPVTSALWLILNMLCIAGLYLTLNAEFIGVIQILVYAGAIMVLFLFVIMLLNLQALPHFQNFDWRLGLAFVLGVGVLAQLVYVVASGLDALPEPVAVEQSVEAGSAYRLATDLFTKYAMPVEIIGIMLLVATIGAVMLAKRRFA